MPDYRKLKHVVGQAKRGAQSFIRAGGHALKGAKSYHRYVGRLNDRHVYVCSKCGLRGVLIIGPHVDYTGPLWDVRCKG